MSGFSCQTLQLLKVLILSSKPSTAPSIWMINFHLILVLSLAIETRSFPRVVCASQTRGLVSKDPALALVLYVPDYHQLTSAVKARFLLLHSSLSFFSQPCPSLLIMLAILHLGWAKCTTPFWSRLAKLQRNFAHWPKFCHSTIHAPEGVAVILIKIKIHQKIEFVCFLNQIWKKDAKHKLIYDLSSNLVFPSSKSLPTL